MHDWALGTGDHWVSMAVPADGSYGIEPGVIYSYPVRTRDGEYDIVTGLDISEFSRERMDATRGRIARGARRNRASARLRHR